VILEMLIDKEAPSPMWSPPGYDRETVKKVERLIYISEYKRFQSAPGTRLTKRAFWLDRRYPIVNRWRDNERQLLSVLGTDGIKRLAVPGLLAHLGGKVRHGDLADVDDRTTRDFGC
jgi:hypothetical protein